MQPDLLSSILDAIAKRVNQQSFDMWFKPISQAREDPSSIYLAVPNEVFRDWISNHYFDVIEESLQELGLEGRQVRFTVSEPHAASIRAPSGFSELRLRSSPPRATEEAIAATAVARA